MYPELVGVPVVSCCAVLRMSVAYQELEGVPIVSCCAVPRMSMVSQELERCTNNYLLCCAKDVCGVSRASRVYQ
jgi:hypothetical protein